ncbi:MAG: protein phosphatase 2C domain-containing protein [Myxococcales bacterium]|nr:protein phosphatase 2C domain-containing protein [Myxococcales bacterium]
MAATLTTRAAGSSDVGRKRDRNEDSFLVDEELGLYVVSDGMGGHAAGEVASQATVAAVQAYVAEHRETIEAVRHGEEPPEALRRLADGAAKAACREVYALARQSLGRTGMGATLTLVISAGPFAALGHIGDSRLYLLRDGTVDQLTFDHTIASEMLRSGLIDEEELERSPYKHVLSRACGTQPQVSVDSLLFEIFPGDRLLLCSDGYSNYLEDPTSLVDALAGEEPAEVAAALVAFANEAGGKDNITAVVVEVRGDHPHAARAALLAERQDALRAVFLFEHLELPLLTRVMNVCDVEVYEAGETVMAEGAVCHELLVVLDGVLALARGGESLGQIESGEHVGASTLVEARPARASLTAVEASRVLRLRGRAFAQISRDRPWLGIGLLERLGSTLSEALDRSWKQRQGQAIDGPTGERL